MIKENLTDEGGQPVKTAFEIADAYVVKSQPQKAHYLKKNAPWKSELATFKQLNYLKSLGVELVDYINITQGKASQLIDQAMRDQQSQKFN